MVFSSPKEGVKDSSARSAEPWKVLVVDDEPIVHSVTELVLRDFAFGGRKVRLYSAYGEGEAQKILEREKDLAVALVDVVMERDNSGLRLIQWIREILKNRAIRLILRTGQPGIAPEKDIISRYEINDYKEKTELTDVKLMTSLTVAIRGYRDLVDLQKNRTGFARILEHAGEFWRSSDEAALMERILGQFGRLFDPEGSSRPPRDCFALFHKDGTPVVRTGLGSYEVHRGTALEELGVPAVSALMERCTRREPVRYERPYLVCSLDTRQTAGLFLVMNSEKEPDKTDNDVLRAFLVHSSLALDYWLLTANKSRSQKNMLIFLSEVIEHHFTENGNHIRRVSEMMYLVSRKIGIDRDRAERWKMASILHDMGKIGIPDRILKKPDKLSPEEFEVMKSHVLIGHKLLSSNKDEFFPDAADIALSHHEKWNGQGYPSGLKGEEIPLPARILTVIDVFDALTHKRVYKEAWPVETAVRYILDRRGEDFDPDLVDSFISIVPDLQWVLDEYPD